MKGCHCPQRNGSREEMRSAGVDADETGEGKACIGQLIYDLFSFGVGGKGNDGESPPCYRNSWFTRKVAIKIGW